MPRKEVCPYNYFPWCAYIQSPWALFISPDEFWVRVTNITSRIIVSRTQTLYSNFVGCESLLQSNSPAILALSETNLED